MTMVTCSRWSMFVTNWSASISLSPVPASPPTNPMPYSWLDRTSLICERSFRRSGTAASAAPAPAERTRIAAANADSRRL